MQSTGQTSTQALSLTLMQGSAITYAIAALLLNSLPGKRSDVRSARDHSTDRDTFTNLSRTCQAAGVRTSAQPGPSAPPRPRRPAPYERGSRDVIDGSSPGLARAGYSWERRQGKEPSRPHPVI